MTDEEIALAIWRIFLEREAEIGAFKGTLRSVPVPSGSALGWESHQKQAAEELLRSEGFAERFGMLRPQIAGATSASEMLRVLFQALIES